MTAPSAPVGAFTCGHQPALLAQHLYSGRLEDAAATAAGLLLHLALFRYSARAHANKSAGLVAHRDATAGVDVGHAEGPSAAMMGSVSPVHLGWGPVPKLVLHRSDCSCA